MKNSYLVVPFGDAAGIGVEIILKALQRVKEPVVVVGDRDLIEKTAQDVGLPFPFESVVTSSGQLRAAQREGRAPILYHLDLIDLSTFAYGAIQAQCGRGAFESVRTAVDLIEEGLASAVVTPPLHKEALKAAGIEEIGYTEILASLSDSPKPTTMFDTHKLKIFFHSRHLSLIDACRAVTKESLLQTIVTSDEITGKHPSFFDTTLPLAVAGLNPHNGDGGLFGQEELLEVIPAIRAAQKQGIRVVGPIGADSVFHQAKTGSYRAVVSLYHDQGHIAAKTYDFDNTISITWGLPFFRSSVDHGTAFDIAGKGKANEQGMVRALEAAAFFVGGTT
ncbi:MAG: 4-hydroxythreonine-4-phosphate dehydrogenase [Spirochaetales bacterium]|nr:4-hydroxythreonine-4-phosphate dehydrogenase [Spirochaetales bacterium]